MIAITGENTFEHGGKWLAATRAWDLKNGPLLDFSANINPYGIADSVQAAIAAALPDIVHYPDSEASELKQAIATQYHVPQDSIVAGNGAVELLYLLCQYRRPEHVLIPAPTFSEYERAARSAGADVEYFPLAAEDGFAFDAAAFCERLAHADIGFICNPNNPTGRLTERAAIRQAAQQAAKTGALLVVDESFIDFVENGNEYSCRSLLSEFPNLCILHSLTKFYAIPGLRLGFMLCGAELARELELRKDPWNVNTLAQSAGVAGLKDLAYQAASRSYLRAERDWLLRALQAIEGMKICHKGAANYLLLNLSAFGLTAAEFVARLAEKGILVRNCANYPGLGDAYVRVAVRSRAENERLATSIRQVV